MSLPRDEVAREASARGTAARLHRGRRWRYALRLRWGASRVTDVRGDRRGHSCASHGGALPRIPARRGEPGGGPGGGGRRRSRACRTVTGVGEAGRGRGAAGCGGERGAGRAGCGGGGNRAVPARRSGGAGGRQPLRRACAACGRDAHPCGGKREGRGRQIDGGGQPGARAARARVARGAPRRRHLRAERAAHAGYPRSASPHGGRPQDRPGRALRHRRRLDGLLPRRQLAGDLAWPDGDEHRPAISEGRAVGRARRVGHRSPARHRGRAADAGPASPRERRRHRHDAAGRGLAGRPAWHRHVRHGQYAGARDRGEHERTTNARAAGRGTTCSDTRGGGGRPQRSVWRSSPKCHSCPSCAPAWIAARRSWSPSPASPVANAFHTIAAKVADALAIERAGAGA